MYIFKYLKKHLAVALNFFLPPKALLINPLSPQSLVVKHMVVYLWSIGQTAYV